MNFPNTAPVFVFRLTFPLMTAVMVPSRSPVIAVTSTRPRKWSTPPPIHSLWGGVTETVVSVKLTWVLEACAKARGPDSTNTNNIGMMSTNRRTRDPSLPRTTGRRIICRIFALLQGGRAARRR